MAEFSGRAAELIRGSTIGDLYVDQWSVMTDRERLTQAPLPVLNAELKSLGAPEDVLTAYGVDLQGPFTVGIPAFDHSVRQHEQGARRDTLSRFKENYLALQAGSFAIEPPAAGVGRQDRRNRKQALRGQSLEARLRHPMLQRWAEDTQETQHRGIYRSPLLERTAVCFYYWYLNEMGVDEKVRDTLAYTVAKPDVAFFQAGGETVSPGERLSFAKISDTLQAQGRVDLSQRVLDERVAIFDGLAKIELATLAFMDLRELGAVGGKRQGMALSLFRPYKDHLGDLFKDNGMPILRLLGDIGMAFAEAYDRTPATERRSRRLLEALGHRSAGVAWHMTSFTSLLVRIYKNQGYVLPPNLKHLDADQEGVAGAAPGTTSAEDTGALVEGMPGEAENALDAEAPGSTVPTDATPEAVAVAGIAVQTEEERLRRAMFEQLDEIILPTDGEGSDGADFERQLREIVDNAAAETANADKGVIWARLLDLVEISKDYGGKLYRSKKESMGGAPPYFVCVFEYEEDTYAVAESPVYGNATYIVAQKHAVGTWLEILKLRRTDARWVGAVALRHSKKSPHGPGHRTKIHNKINELAITAGIY